MSQYWLKLYIEILDDPCIATLNDHQWRKFVEMLLLAKDRNRNGELPNVDEMAWRLRATVDDILAVLKVLEQASKDNPDDRGVVYFVPEANRWVFTHFKDRQDKQTASARGKAWRKAHPGKRSLGDEQPPEPETPPEAPFENGERKANETFAKNEPNARRVEESRGESEEESEEESENEPTATKLLKTLGISATFEGPQLVHVRTLNSIIQRVGYQDALTMSKEALNNWTQSVYNLGWVPKVVEVLAVKQ